MMITVDDELLVSTLHTALWSALKITDERRRRRDHDYSAVWIKLANPASFPHLHLFDIVSTSPSRTNPVLLTTLRKDH